MVSFKIETPDTFSVGKGPRDGSWHSSIEIDVSKLSPEIMSLLAMHGLKQKIADAAAGAQSKDDADALMGKALDALIAGEWSSRGTGEGVSVEQAIARSLVRAAIKSQLDSKSPEWKAFDGLDKAEQNKKLDANYEANKEIFEPEVQAELKRRQEKAAQKAKLSNKINFAI